MAAPSRALSWILGSRLRVAAALAMVAIVAVGLVVLRGGDDGDGQRVDASSSMVRAGKGSSSTTGSTATDSSESSTSHSNGPMPRARRAPMHIITKKAREAAAHDRRVAAGDSSHARRTARRSRHAATPAPAPAPNGSPSTPPPSGSPSSTTTTAPPAGSPSTTTTTTPPQPATNGSIAAVEPTDGTSTRIVVLSADGSGRTPVTDGQHADAAPAWSPDGTRLAFDRVVDGTRKLFVVKTDGTGLLPLATDGSAQRPVWSPDGTKLAFVADAGDVHVIDVASGSVAVVADQAATADTAVTWSPDGTLLAWDGDGGIVVAAPDGSGREQLTSGDDHGPVWSPDGARLLVRRGSTVVTVDRNGVVSKAIATDDGFGDLEWAPDGSSFLYDCDGSLCVRHADGSARAVLADRVTDADWAAAPSSPSSPSSTTTTSTSTTSTTQP